MHQCNLDVSINKLSKIEGHADLDIKIRDGKVKEVNLSVMENIRFFNQAVKGLNYNNAPQLVSRVCGTCSIAHLTACIEAVEKALEIKPSAQTIMMRKLTMYSMMIRDHALHLYFFVLPDIFGVDSLLDLADSRKDLIVDALKVKEAGNNLSNLIAGRAVHATFEQVGGFVNQVDKGKIPMIKEELESIKGCIIKLSDILFLCGWKMERKTDFVALVTPDFSFLEGRIKSISGALIEEKDYWNHLHDVILPYSQANGFQFEGHEFMVGSLARINLNKGALHAKTKKSMEKYLCNFPSNNIYDNNLAQAIEIMHSIDHSLDLLDNFDFKKEIVAKPAKLTGEGVGVIEAPRGTLYYWLGIDEGKIRYANMVIPTAQNLINMRADVKKAVTDICSCDLDDRVCANNIRKEAEKIIRAYDPCMSCASHFLTVNFSQK